MEIFGLCVIGILAAIMALLLRRQSPQTALLLSVGAGTLIILSVLKNILLTTEGINSLLQAGGINADYIVTNNIKDFAASTISAVIPADMLKILVKNNGE